MNRSLVGTVLGTSLLLGSAKAENWVQNPDFNEGMSGWPGGSGWATNPSAGSRTAPSLQFRDNNNYYIYNAAMSQCISLDGRPPPWDFGGRIRNALANQEIMASMYLRFSESPCGGPTIYSSFEYPYRTETVHGVDGDYQQFARTILIDPHGTNVSRSVKFILSVATTYTGVNADVRFDALYFGPLGTTPVALTSFTVD